MNTISLHKINKLYEDNWGGWFSGGGSSGGSSGGGSTPKKEDPTPNQWGEMPNGSTGTGAPGVIDKPGDVTAKLASIGGGASAAEIEQRYAREDALKREKAREEVLKQEKAREEVLKQEKAREDALQHEKERYAMEDVRNRDKFQLFAETLLKSETAQFAQNEKTSDYQKRRGIPFDVLTYVSDDKARQKLYDLVTIRNPDAEYARVYYPDPIQEQNKLMILENRQAVGSYINPETQQNINAFAARQADIDKKYEGANRVVDRWAGTDPYKQFAGDRLKNFMGLGQLGETAVNVGHFGLQEPRELKRSLPSFEQTARRTGEVLEAGFVTPIREKGIVGAAGIAADFALLYGVGKGLGKAGSAIKTEATSARGKAFMADERAVAFPEKIQKPLTTGELKSFVDPVIEKMGLSTKNINVNIRTPEWFEEKGMGKLEGKAQYFPADKEGIINIKQSKNSYPSEIVREYSHESGHLFTEKGLTGNVLIDETEAMRFSHKFLDEFNSMYGTKIKPRRLEDYKFAPDEYKQAVVHADATAKEPMLFRDTFKAKASSHFFTTEKTTIPIKRGLKAFMADDNALLRRGTPQRLKLIEETKTKSDNVRVVNLETDIIGVQGRINPYAAIRAQGRLVAQSAKPYSYDPFGDIRAITGFKPKRTLTRSQMKESLESRYGQKQSTPQIFGSFEKPASTAFLFGAIGGIKSVSGHIADESIRELSKSDPQSMQSLRSFESPISVSVTKSVSAAISLQDELQVQKQAQKQQQKQEQKQTQAQKQALRNPFRELQRSPRRPLREPPIRSPFDSSAKPKSGKKAKKETIFGFRDYTNPIHDLKGFENEMKQKKTRRFEF